MKTDAQETTIHRLKIIEGHIKKVREMVETGEYCIDVLHQTGAVRKALESAEEAILENHLRTCVRTSMKEGKDEERVIQELLTTLKASHS